MANSERYNEFINRVKFLESNILPESSETGDYTKRESDLIRSYVLLLHAEIESYFEDIAREKAKEALSNWKNHKTANNCLLAIMSFCTNEVGWDKVKKEKKERFNFRINTVVKYYIDQISNNHGIKSRNIKNILLPIGLTEDQIDNTWLNTMDNFGKDRGLIAHSAISTQEQIDLTTNQNTMNDIILPEIERLDLLIKDLK